MQGADLAVVAPLRFGGSQWSRCDQG